MKLLIVGSRSIKSFDLSPYIPADVDTVISGGASGIDTLAEQYADLHRLSKYIVRPRYDIYGRAAPLKRNEQMVNMADAVLVVWDGCSNGTRYTLKYTEKNEKNPHTRSLPIKNKKSHGLTLLLIRIFTRRAIHESPRQANFGRDIVFSANLCYNGIIPWGGGLLPP